MIAIVTATSGAAPAITDARAGPASRTPRTKRSCAPPGASSPASRNGHSSPPHSRPIERDRRADAEPAERRRERADQGVAAPAHREAERDRHAAEEQGGGEREGDPGHRSEPNGLALRHGDRASLRGRRGRDRQPLRRAPGVASPRSACSRGATSRPQALERRRAADLRQVRLHRPRLRDRRPGRAARRSTSGSSRPRRRSSRTPPRALAGRCPGATMMTIQNGLGAEELVRAQGDWPLLSAVTFMSGVRHSDTHVEYELDTETWLGPFAGTTTYEQAQEIEALLVASGLHARAFPDLRPAQWSKLIFNATVNTVAALTDLPHVGAFAARRRADRPRQPRPRPDGRGEGGCRGRGRRAARGSLGDERARRPARRDARRRGPLRPRAVDARGRPRRPPDRDRLHHRRARPRGGAARRSRARCTGDVPAREGARVAHEDRVDRLRRGRVAVRGEPRHARRRRGLGLRPVAGARRRDQRERAAALRRRRRRRQGQRDDRSRRAPAVRARDRRRRRACRPPRRWPRPRTRSARSARSRTAPATRS